MRKEYATLKRRPFLTPVWLTVLAAAFVLFAAGWVLRVASTTVVVIVPASRPAGMPDLVTAAGGEARAALLAALLAAGDAPEGRPQALLTTQTVAATSLAQPLARRLNVKLSTLAQGDARLLTATILDEHRGERLVVVCGEDDVAGLVRGLAGSQALVVPAHAALLIAIPRFSRPAVLALGIP